MQDIHQITTQLAKQFSLTSHDEDPEPYILTAQEEKTVIDNKITAEKKHLAWRMAQIGSSEGDILLKISQVDWESEINREELLKRANSLKSYQVWQQQQREKEKNEAAEKYKALKAQWSAKQMYNLMAYTSENIFGKKLVVHDDNIQLVKAICFFLSQDSRFETELNFSLNKGLFIRGVSGLGKTYLFRCVENNELNPIIILSMIEICNQLKSEGRFTIDPKEAKIIYLDDVGTEEPTVNFYGNKINWFKDFLEMYYLKNKPFKNLIISSNNSFAEIEDKYGYRVRSRMKDMFNIIDVTGKDMRG